MAGMAEQPGRPGLIRRLYDLGMEWIQTPYGLWALFLIAFIESSFFPIPPDVFLIALCLAAPHKAFRYAAICAAGSVVGGAFGYALGMWFMDSVGTMVMNFYGLTEKYEVVRGLYQEYDVWAVGAAGFTPLPYKLFTITAGAFDLNFPTFMLVSLISRSARFFLVAAFIWKFGPPVRSFLEKYFNLLSVLFMVLLIGGFVLMKLLL